MPLRPVSDWYVELGARLRMLRKQKRLTLQAAAANLGCAWQMLQRYETGTSRLYADTLVALSDLYEIPLEQLLTTRSTAQSR